MENIKDFIHSGLLELYAVGDLNKNERTKVENLASKYTSVNAEKNEIEYALERYAFEKAIEPDPAIRDKIFIGLFSSNDRC